MSYCVICHTEFNRPAMACTKCQQRMDSQLADIVEFYALTEGELIPGSSGQRGSGNGIGVRISALDFLAGNDVVDVLTSWEADWRETYGLSIDGMLQRPGAILTRTVSFLRTWLPNACDTFEPIDDFSHELWQQWSKARTAARMEPARKLGIECPGDLEDNDDGLCRNRIPVDAEQLRGQVQCRRCKTVWNVAHLMHVAIVTTHVWADPEAAAGYFCISTRDFVSLTKRAGIDPEHGRYDMHAINAMIEERRLEGYTRLARAIVNA